MIDALKPWRLRFGLGVPPSTGTKESLQWLMFGRLGALYTVLSILVVQQIFRHEALSSFQIVLAYGLLAVCFGFNLGHAIVIDRVGVKDWIVGSHILFDAILTSSWLFLSGSRDSLFALLYLIQILIVSITLYQRGALLSSVASALCFGLVMVLQPQAYANPVLTWFTYSVLFMTLGMVGGYLSEELLRTTLSLKEKQLKIEKLMALHERIISNLPTGLLTVDSSMRINFINPAGEWILGRTNAQIVGQKLFEVEPGLLPFFSQIESENIIEEPEEVEQSLHVERALSATRSEHHKSFFVQAKSDKGKARLQQRVEIGRGPNEKILRGDVADLAAEAGLGKLLDEEATGGRVLLFQDVTKLLHLEEKLKQNEKLAAVGQLAAGIAHEIRNPLASMSASIEMLKGTLPPAPNYAENQKLMEIAIREIDRLNRLVSEFLDFVKPDKLKFESVNLEKLMGDLILGIQQSKEFKERAKIVKKLDADVVAYAHPEKLKQVILNLLVNAVQAMSKEGVLEVGCRLSGTNRVKFWVQDHGCGMSEEVLSHLYEPFFTTKEKGTGLGLATAYKIVEAHHGEIRVDSKLNEGTRFEVYLPRAS